MRENFSKFHFFSDFVLLQAYAFPEMFNDRTGAPLVFSPTSVPRMRTPVSHLMAS